MHIDIISCVPDQLESPLNTSIMKRAQDKGLAKIQIHNLRDYTEDKHKTVDDTPYGGGPGMVMKVEPIARCIRALQADRTFDEIILLTPDGETLTQNLANQLSLSQNILMLAGHYKGVDQRVRELFITREISIGDYVLSGGELPALVLTDAIVRLLPGVLGDEASALSDSFQDNMLEPPIYTRPPEFEGKEVPEILRSGHTAKIEAWKEEEAYRKTLIRRPDLLGMTEEEAKEELAKPPEPSKKKRKK